MSVKRKSPLSDTVKRLATEFQKDSLVAEGSTLICRCCILEMNVKRSQILQHLNTEKHKKNLGIKCKQQLISETYTERDFNSDLCKVCTVSCNL